MPFALRDDLYWCECAGRVVFLDVVGDRYFCLPTSATGAFLRMASGEPHPLDAEHLTMLTKRGFLVKSVSPIAFRQPVTIERPARDVVQEFTRRSGLVPLLRALVWEARAAWQLRNRRFSDVVMRARRHRRHWRATSPNCDQPVQSIAVAADAIALVTRAHDRCLVRALGVYSACRSRGIRAKLVLGVIAHPFAAHSWVQLGDAVLVGGFEQARLYTPILVIE